jgi:hypothetical protein
MEKKNFLQQVSFAFKHGKDKAREEFSGDEREELEKKKKKRKLAMAFFEPEEEDQEE